MIQELPSPPEGEGLFRLEGFGAGPAWTKGRWLLSVGNLTGHARQSGLVYQRDH